MLQSERLTDEIKEIGTNTVLAYRLKSGVKQLTSTQRLGQYESIGSVEEFKELKEKNEPKKPLEIDEKTENDFYYLAFICPSCKSAIIGQPYRPNYCKCCGQKLEWK